MTPSRQRAMLLVLSSFLIAGLSEPLATDSLVLRTEVHVCLHTLPETDQATGIRYDRLAVLAAPVAVGLGATYFYLENKWWAQNERRFGFDDGSDLRYALNLDKAAHFVGGVFSADLAYYNLRWANVPERDAYLWAAGFATLMQLIIEIKDGYAPNYGFSVWDLAAGAAGGFYPMAQRYVEPVGRTHVKFSYYRRTEAYFMRDHSSKAWINDYINQTYWLAFDLHSVLPEAMRPFWPEPLGLALGFSTDDTLDGVGGGRVEVYLGLDIDLMKFVPEGENPWWAHLLRALNYYRQPLPALRLTPRLTLLAFE